MKINYTYKGAKDTDITISVDKELAKVFCEKILDIIRDNIDYETINKNRSIMLRDLFNSYIDLKEEIEDDTGKENSKQDS